MIESGRACLPFSRTSRWVSLSYLQSRTPPPLTSLHSSVQTGDMDTVAKLISKSVVNGKDSFGNTPLIYAVKNGSTEIVTYLIGYGADIDSADSV